jgi:hypothetical protein
MIDLASSSDEEGLIPDASHDFEFVQQLFGELNRDLLGPPGNGKMKSRRRFTRRNPPAPKMLFCCS